MQTENTRKFCVAVLSSLVCFTLISLLGCAPAPFSPVANHLTDSFANLNTPGAETIKSAGVKQYYPVLFDDTWEGCLRIIAQHGIFADVRKDAGTIMYVDVDGVNIATVHTDLEGVKTTNNRVITWDFPFTVLIEEGQEGTTAYIYYMKELYDVSRNKGLAKLTYLETIDAASRQKAAEFLYQLDIYLTSRSRWSWLTHTAESGEAVQRTVSFSKILFEPAKTE
jgi:hypothetical protein